MIRKTLLNSIRKYQQTGPWRVLISQAFSGNGRAWGSCRFSPTCSQYMYEAVSRYGIVKGVFLGIKRIARCHPFSAGGLDPVPNL